MKLGKRGYLVALTLILILIPILFSTPHHPSPLPINAPATSPPVLGGWGGNRLMDTEPNRTAPASLVFPNETQSNFEQSALREFSLGYNAVRVSFAPYCSVQYRLNTLATPQDFMGNYSSAQLDRAIRIAQRLNLWLIVDYHGYTDWTNSTLVDCWQKFWFGPDLVSGPTGVVGSFSNSYSRIIWEPLNEPDAATFPIIRSSCNKYPSQCDDNSTAYMSSQYQSWLDKDRAMGDSHWVVVQNLCSFACDRPRSQYYLDYPVVNDSLSSVSESFHTYLNYGLATTASDGTSGHYSYWNTTTADIFAEEDYLTMVHEVQNLGWQILNTEGGTSCGTVNGTTCLRSSLAILPGPAGYTTVSLRYIQDMVNYEDNNAPRFGQLLWPAAPWATGTSNTGVYGAFNPGQWGTMLSYVKFEVSPIVTIFGVQPDPAFTLQKVSVDFNVTEPSGWIASISVSWGDGSWSTLGSTAKSASHSYASVEPSTIVFDINVTAMDDGGSIGYAAQTVTVNNLPHNLNDATKIPYATILYIGTTSFALGCIATFSALYLRGRNRKRSQAKQSPG